jgi:hypothetical protein
MTEASAGTLRPASPAAAWRDAAILLALFVLGRLITAGVSDAWIALNPDLTDRTLSELLCRWDCKWYIYIAEKGYDPVAKHWERGDGTNWAFFPLLPVLMAAISDVTGLAAREAGYVVANAAFLTAVIAFYAYVRDLHGERFALFAGGMLALWPYSVHATVPMSEAVYLPASILVFLFARRGDWIAAGLAAAAMSASRAVGMFVVVPLLVLAVQQFGWRALVTLRPDATRVVLAMALAGFGLGLFMTHLWLTTGDALAFSHLQTAWARRSEWPWVMLVNELSPWFWGTDSVIRKSAHLATALAGLGLTVVLVRRRLLAEAALVWATLAVAFTSGAVMSFARFTGVLFPRVLAVALLADRSWLRLPALVASAALLAGMTYLWVALYNYAM